MDRDGLSPFDLVVLILGGGGVLLVLVVWAGAALALAVSGQPVELSVGQAVQALPRIVDHLDQPADAWPAPGAGWLPGAVVYWSCTGVAAISAGALVVAAVRFLAGPRAGTLRRWPLGVDARPTWATTRALRPLLVGADKHPEFSSRLGDRCDAAEPVAVSPGVVGQHGRVSSIRLRACGTPTRTRRVEPGRFSHEHRMTGSGNQPDDEPLAAFDRNGQIQRVSERGQLAEELPEVVVGVLDQPLLDDRAVIVDDAHPVMRRAPVPSAEHALLTPSSDIGLFALKWGAGGS